MKYVIEHNSRIIDIVDQYNSESLNGEELVKVFVGESEYYIGTPDRNEYNYHQVDAIPEDYYDNYLLNEETGEYTLLFYYEYNSGLNEFIKINL